MNLNAYREAKAGVLKILDEIEELNQTLISSPTLDGIPSKTHNRAGLDHDLIRRDELAGALREASAQAVQAMESVEESISLVEDPNTRTILRFRYISGKSWKEIAERTGYNERTLYRRHREGVSLIEKSYTSELIRV